METSVNVRLLTQNMFIRPPGINTNGNDYKDDRKNLLLSKVLPNYDIVCLQEMFRFGSFRHSTVIKEAKKIGFEYYASSPSRGFLSLGIDAGLLILSRHEIVYSEFSQYERGVQSDALSLKGALYARVNVSPEKPTYVNIFTTHTQASYGKVPLDHPSVRKRISQTVHLRKFIDRTLQAYCKPDEPLFLVGDMNVDSRTHLIIDENANTDTNNGECYGNTANKSTEKRKTEPPTRRHEKEEDGNASSVEYEAMMGILRGDGIPDPSMFGLSDKFDSTERLSLIDSLYDHLGYHPVTSGNTRVDENGNLIPMETVLTSKNDSSAMKSLDYIFVAVPASTNTLDAQNHSSNAQAQAQAETVAGVCPNSGPESFFVKNTDSRTHANTNTDTNADVHSRKHSDVTVGSGQAILEQDNGSATAVDNVIATNPSIIDSTNTNTNPGSFRVLEANSQPNFVQSMPFIQISDHYGAEAKIEFVI